MRALVVLLLCCSARAWGECGFTDDRTVTHRPVYVVLIGHPDAPGLDRLKFVGEDVRQMYHFFQMLSPEHTFVHLDPPRESWVAERLAEERVELLPPTAEAIAASVAQITQAANGREVDVYVYYSGHGQLEPNGSKSFSRLFLADPDEPGQTLELSPERFGRDVLDPLKGRGTVHLILDACQSLYFLARGEHDRPHQPRRPPELGEAIRDFFAKHRPWVGASIATRGDAFAIEDPQLGGRFSTALRSAASGLADANRDGVITYKELAHTVSILLRSMPKPAEPWFAGPGGKDSAVFMDLRNRPQIDRVCLPADAGRLSLYDRKGGLHIIVHLDQAPLLHLPKMPPELRYFVVGDRYVGLPIIDELEMYAQGKHPYTLRGDAWQASKMLEKPLHMPELEDRIKTKPMPEEARGPWKTRNYVTLGVGAGGATQLTDKNAGELIPQYTLSLGVARDAWQIVQVYLTFDHSNDEAEGFDYKVVTAEVWTGWVALGGQGQPWDVTLAGGPVVGTIFQHDDVTDENHRGWKAGVSGGVIGRYNVWDDLFVRLDARAGAEWTNPTGNALLAVPGRVILGADYAWY